MASLALVFKDAEFRVGPAASVAVPPATAAAYVDMSIQVRSITINYSKELLDASAMGVGATRQRVAGLLDWSMDIEFNQTFIVAGTGIASVDATLFPLIQQETTAWVSVVPVKAQPVSGTNPQFHGDAFLATYPPISGGVAAVAIVTANFQGSGALLRALARVGAA